MAEPLKVAEMYLSIQGESSRAGLPCVIVRLAGCNLACTWCDTPQARAGGTAMTAEDILHRLAELTCRRVLVTGGEPLLQPGALELMRRLCEAGCETMLETNGSLDISPVDRRVRRIIDIKCPASGQAEANRWENVEHLRDGDEVKFVLADRNDYDYACQAVRKRDLTARCEVIFSPVHQRLPAGDLAKWILADKLDVRLGVQLHKIVWPNEPGGV